jgi:hypothetical protein
VHLIMTEGARYICLGLVVGLALALGVVRTLETLLFGLTPADPVTFLQVTATVALAALLAVAMPALRAASARNTNIHCE